MSLPKTYKSVVIEEAGGDWAIKDVELKQPGEGEILVKVSHCGVCHSDSGAQAGHFGPMVRIPHAIDYRSVLMCFALLTL